MGVWLVSVSHIRQVSETYPGSGISTENLLDFFTSEFWEIKIAESISLQFLTMISVTQIMYCEIMHDK
jgi:hypothetical protein